MALENYRPIQFPEKTEIDNTDVVLIDSSTNGTNKYQLTRLRAQAQADAQALVAAEAAAREQDVDDLKEDLTSEQTARANADIALQTAINAKADSTALTAEATARQNADSNLQTSINNEKTAREAYGFSVVNGILNVTYTTTEVGGE